MCTDLFIIKKIDFNTFFIQLSDKNHQVFKAHFVNNPVLPAFVYFHICEKIFEHKIIGIKKAKFISFSKPNDRLLLKYEIKDDVYHITFSCEYQKVCTISYNTTKGKLID